MARQATNASIDVLGVDESTMVRVVDDLERQGLLVRQRDPNDRRAYAVQLTDQGRQRLDAAHAATRDLGAHLFGWLSDQDRRRLHATLHRIIQAAQSPSHGDRHWPSTSASKKDNGANVARRDTRASRYGVLSDPFGHRLAVATAREQLTPTTLPAAPPDV